MSKTTTQMRLAVEIGKRIKWSIVIEIESHRLNAPIIVIYRYSFARRGNYSIDYSQTEEAFAIRENQ